ncbi:unnamed protein product [Schistocephalus solidus]|uniref:Paramyosin n=1 Tax=Schistocephalus solidus TaxID=70667 RepID=A0A183SDE7_SCHSO|nr:unnamed protein product [Schistocephalus solidus]
MRIAELEERLEEERSFRNKNQRETCEYALEIESLNQRLEEANETINQQLDVIKRREAESAMVQKERDILKQTHEADAASARRRFQASLNEQQAELEDMRKSKSKLEKERSELFQEVEKLANELSKVQKLNEALEGKIDGLESHSTRLKAGSEDLLRQLAEMKARNSSLMAGEAENVKNLDKTNNALSIAQRQVTALQKELDDLKRQLNEEISSREHLQSRQTLLQTELESAEARAEDEAENAAQVQQQLSKTNAELGALRNRHERELGDLQAEMDELK